MEIVGLHLSFNTARRELAGAGTQTAALAFGGYDTANTGATEEYDGISWTTSPGSLNTARNFLGGAGTQTAGLAFGGYTTTPTGATEEYNGSTWTSSGSLGTARFGLGGAGTQTAGLAFGGYSGPTDATEEYDGTTWTTNPTSLNTARYFFRRSRNSNCSFSFWWLYWHSCYSSNRRMEWCRFSINKNNYSKLTGGKYGNKNIHRS
jgi:hypothetical protein